MTGVRVGEFDTLAKEVLPQFEAAESGRLGRTTRQRAVGGGEKPHLDSRDQLVLTVIWLRQYPTHDVLGFFFGVSQPTVGRYIERMRHLVDIVTNGPQLTKHIAQGFHLGPIPLRPARQVNKGQRTNPVGGGCALGLRRLGQR